MMPLILNNLISFFVKKRIRKIESFKKNPIDIQKKCLSHLLQSAQKTEIGEKFKFSSIKHYTDFKNRLPVTNYEDIEGTIKRIIKGEQNLLWHSKITSFAKSSGTTNNKSKYIPVSKEALYNCHFNCGKDMLAIYYHNNPSTKIFHGKSLIMGGSRDLNSLSNAKFIGDLSAILIKNLPFWASLLQTPNKAVALMGEWEIKLKEICNIVINKNITSITGVPSWTLVLLNKIINSYNKNISEIWPNLEVFFHGGVNFSPYKNQFQQHFFPSQINYIQTYNASEGFFAVQDKNNANDMLLMLNHGVFYEFILKEDYKNLNYNFIELSEVKINKEYCIVITTNSGLWRYLIGDTICFTSTFPFRIKITGRTKHYINAFGEELIIDNAENALKKACKKTNAIINEYTAAPLYINKNYSGRHHWLIEFNKEPNSLKEFSLILDIELKKLNSDYEAKRYKDIVLKSPFIEVAKKNLFFNWLKSKNKIGGQNKIPRLSNEREYLEELLLLQKQ